MYFIFMRKTKKKFNVSSNNCLSNLIITQPCLPVTNFILVQEIFTRFARAPLSRIFFTAKGSFPYGCNNHMVVDQTWPRKLVAVTRFIACYSQKQVDVNKSKTNLSNCVLCNFHHVLKKSYNIQYISNYKIWKFPLKYLKQPVPLVIL